jgi:glycine dehydrogenase subunit 1
MPSFVPTTARERDEMLRSIGVQSVDQLFEDIPAQFRKPVLDVPAGMSELEVLRHLRTLSELNLDLDHYPSFLGAGAYRHFTPSIISHLVSRGEFLTSYTPYQPEVSQGTLQSVYEWQSLVCELTGMDISNAAVYDAATGVGEAARMACALTRRKRVLVADTVNPLYREVLRTYGGGTWDRHNGRQRLAARRRATDARRRSRRRRGRECRLPDHPEPQLLRLARERGRPRRAAHR